MVANPLRNFCLIFSKSSTHRHVFLGNSKTTHQHPNIQSSFQILFLHHESDKKTYKAVFEIFKLIFNIIFAWNKINLRLLCFQLLHFLFIRFAGFFQLKFNILVGLNIAKDNFFLPGEFFCALLISSCISEYTGTADKISLRSAHLSFVSTFFQ